MKLFVLALVLTTFSTKVLTEYTYSSSKDSATADEITFSIYKDKATLLLKFNVDFNASTNGYDYMVEAQAQGKFNFTAKQYSFGHMITSIQGIEQTSEYYWFLYVNNHDSSVGIDDVKPKVDDDIEWIYSSV